MDYNTPAPPNVVDGNYLSAYWVNQLSQYVNKSADAVYSTNVFQWTYASSVDIAGLAGMYILQHKYNSLRLAVRVETGCSVKVRLSKSDDYTGWVQVYTNNFGSTGDFSISIDLLTSGFSIVQDEIYFCYVEFDKNAPSSYLQWIKYVYEAGDSLIAAPSPALATLTASTTIDKAYLDSLLNAAKGLGQFTSPRSIPFCGVATSTSVNNGNTFLRWRANHIHRYLHMGFLPNGTSGGGNAVIVYLNQQSIYTCANDHVNHDLIFDLTALPNGVAEPSGEYEICIANDQNSGYFKMRYLWELPYL